MKKIQGCCKWIISPQVGGLDEFGYISKIICNFVHQDSDWKDSFSILIILLRNYLRRIVHSRKVMLFDSGANF